MHPQATVSTDDAGLAATLRSLLGDRIVVARVLMTEAVEDAIAALAGPEIALPGGGRMHIQPTPALVAIDMDTGGASSGRQSKAASQQDFNLAALPILARQIRLRDLSGAIVVDFAGLPARRRAALGPALAQALEDDPGGARLLGFTALGLAEIVRPRVHPPLHEIMAGPHAAGLAGLRSLARDVLEQPGRPGSLRASPGVVAALQADLVATADFARLTGHSLMLHSDPTLPPETWRLERP